MADYAKTTWNGPAGAANATQVTSARLNNLEAGVRDAAQDSKQRGPVANRPPASPATKNWMWVDSVTGQLSYCDGASWFNVGGPNPTPYPTLTVIGSAGSGSSFSNGWRKYTNAAFAVPDPSFELGLDGWVRLMVMLDKNGGSWVANEVMFTLPVGARPANIVMFPAWVAGNGMQLGRVDIYPDGTARLVGGAATNPVGYLAMHGFQFKAGA